jgi:hypothetical protein
MTSDAGTRGGWAERTKACWEVTPLVEMHGGARVQVGFDLSLFARIPDMPASDERVRAIEAIWDRLVEIAESLAPLLGASGRVEVTPFDLAARLRPETRFAPEVMLQARLVHPSDHLAPPSEADRDRVRPIEEHLAGLGLRRKSW